MAVVVATGSLPRPRTLRTAKPLSRAIASSVLCTQTSRPSASCLSALRWPSTANSPMRSGSSTRTDMVQPDAGKPCSACQTTDVRQRELQLPTSLNAPTLPCSRPSQGHHSAAPTDWSGFTSAKKPTALDWQTSRTDLPEMPLQFTFPGLQGLNGPFKASILFLRTVRNGGSVIGRPSFPIISYIRSKRRLRWPLEERCLIRGICIQTSTLRCVRRHRTNNNY